MVVEMVPLKGGIGSIFHPPEGKDYKWYISGIYCQLGDYMLPTHLLREPETTIHTPNTMESSVNSECYLKNKSIVL